MALQWRFVAISLVFLAMPGGADVPVTGPADMSLAAPKSLEPGLWQLEERGRASRLICVADPLALLQIQHEGIACSRFVIANEPKRATVHYSCQKAGWGRTTLRSETPRAATIHTQGIAANAPFDYSIQARRVGECGGPVSAAGKR